MNKRDAKRYACRMMAHFAYDSVVDDCAFLEADIDDVQKEELSEADYKRVRAAIEELASELYKRGRFDAGPIT